jgi:hypothetical protein
MWKGEAFVTTDELTSSSLTLSPHDATSRHSPANLTTSFWRENAFPVMAIGDVATWVTMPTVRTAGEHCSLSQEKKNLSVVSSTSSCTKCSLIDGSLKSIESKAGQMKVKIK